MSKINSAESIRGLACMAVVFSHLIFTFYPLLHSANPANIHKMSTLESLVYNSPFGFLYSGSAAVFIFFVLSGYVLSYAILSKKNINQKILSMTVKRYPRLAIPALTSCIIAYLVFFIDVDKSNVSEWFSGYGSFNFGLVDAIYQGTIGAFIFGLSPLNWVLWTMQIELFGSLVVFFLLFIKNKNKILFYLFSLVLPVISLAVSTKFSLGIISFIVGIYIYLYGKKIPSVLAFPSILIGLYLAGVHNYSDSYALFYRFFGDITYTLLHAFSGPLIVFGILMHGKISQFLDKKSLVFLGKLSFSIYLLHMIIIYALGIPFFNLMLNNHFSYFISSISASLVVVVLTIFFAYFYSKYIDDFSIKVTSKIEKMIIR